MFQTDSETKISERFWNQMFEKIFETYLFAHKLRQQFVVSSESVQNLHQKKEIFKRIIIDSKLSKRPCLLLAESH